MTLDRKPLVDFVPKLVQKRRLGIQVRLFLLQVLLFSLLMVILAGIQIYVFQQAVRKDYGERALIISRTVAQITPIIEAFDAQDPAAIINPLANRIRQQVGADYIVVGNKQGIRYSHPLPDRIGKPMVGGDNDEPLAGREIISVATGSLGTAIRGKVPVLDARGAVIGVVSTGYLLPTVQSIAARVSLTLLPWFGLGLLFALLSSVWMSRRIKREMFDLEPEQIAALVLQHRSVLSALQEGVLVVDEGGRVQIANPRAAQMLGIPGHSDTPLAIAQVWPQLEQSGLLQASHRENESLAIGTLPVLVGVFKMGKGHLVTFRDRAEILHMAEELTQTRRYADLLRAQTHEFMNRLHTIAGLIQLGKPGEALGVIRSEARQVGAVRDLIAAIEVPRVAALIIGKYERARELGIQFELEPGSLLHSEWSRVSGVLELVVGNLVENAFEAVLEKPRQASKQVTLMIGEDPEGLQIEVCDDGRGVLAGLQQRIFERGVSSKGEGRGFGLHLVQQQVEGLGGSLQHFKRGELTVFQVSLPATQSSRESP